MKKTLQISLLFLWGALLTAQPVAASKKVFVDGTLVSLGNEAILWSELQKTKEMIRLGAVNQGLFYPSADSAKPDHRALDVLINEKLIKIYCEKMKIEIAADAVSNQIQYIIKSTRGVSSEDDLEKQLALEGQSLASFKKRLQKDLLFQKFFQSVIAPQVADLDKEVERQSILDKNLQELTVVTLKRLAIACEGSDKSCSRVLSQMKEIRKSLDSGVTFDAMIKKYSVETGHSLETSQYSLADIGLPALKEALLELGEGQVTKPIKLDKTYYLFKVVKKDHKKDPQFMAKVREKIFLKKFKEWITARRAEVYIPTDYGKILGKSKT